MITFDPFYLLLLIFLVNFIPGTLISFAFLKNKELLFVEKVFIGFAIGLVILPSIPFLLGLIGILYSFQIAILSVIVLYLFAIYLFIKEKPWDDYKDSLNLSLNRKKIISLLLIFIIFLSFWIRFQSYSPIFYDLDPYYYVYSAFQILEYGIPPLDDQTAWYPEVVVDHRVVPTLSYLEAIWYSFYTMDGEYDNYLLSLVASLYPPIMAMIAMFFLYLFVSSIYRREFGLVSAAVATMMPILIMKLAASEFEVQAYAFFSVSFFLATYALAVRKEDLRFALISSLGLAAVVLGSNSIIIPVVALLLFIPLQSLLMFFKRDKEELFAFLKVNSIVFILGFLLPSLLKGMYINKSGIGNLHYVVFSMIIFSSILYYLKDKIKDMKKLQTYFAAFLVISLLIFTFTPIGDLILGIAKGSLSIGQFTTSLSRTISEQAAAGSSFSTTLGFIGVPFQEPLNLLFLPFTTLSNFLLSSMVELGNNYVGTSLSIAEKTNSPVMVIFFFSIIALISSFYRNLKGPHTLSIFFFAAIFPPIFIGLLKAKYILYAGFLFAAALGITLGEFAIMVPLLFGKIMKDEEKTKDYSKKFISFLLAVGLLFAIFQFFYHTPASGILMSSLQPRFQDDPLALQEKFQDLCKHFATYGQSDEHICSAAEDPLAYASQGTNYQFNQKLCIYSLIDGKTDPTPLEQQAFNFRCGGINDYWIDTMEWIKNNPDSNMRITSWWDYGHWINFFGEKNSVLRNEHASLYLIGEVAHNYLRGTPEELKDFMIAHDSKYALFDAELLFSGGGFGGKYGALNYLSCSRNNETDVSRGYMQSQCEFDQLWETVYVPKPNIAQECVISPLSGQTGIISFKQTYSVDSLGNIQSIPEPYYCAGATTLSNGQEINVLYYLNEFNPGGDLKLNKGVLINAGADDSTTVYHVGYSKDLMWVENGELTNGWEDRKGYFYDSNLYNAFITSELEGFELVFQSIGGKVKIYKLKE